MKNNKGDRSRPEQRQDKDTTFSLKSKVLSILKSEKATAIMINRRFGTNDARKIISDLRGDGYPIADYRLPDGRKVYFLKEVPQPDLFKKGGTYDVL